MWTLTPRRAAPASAVVNRVPTSPDVLREQKPDAEHHEDNQDGCENPGMTRDVLPLSSGRGWHGTACCNSSAGPPSGALLPDPRKIDDHLDSLFHVLDRHPFEPRVEVLFPREDVRCGESHERQLRAVGPAADRSFVRRHAVPANGLAGDVDNTRIRVEDFPHVSILLLDRHLNPCAMS